MRALYVFCALLLLTTPNKLFAQEFEVPLNYELNAAADYAKYEKDIIDAAKWLKITPIDKEKPKHKDVYSFVINWVNGSPTVTVEIYEILIDFEKKNPGMLPLYMAFCSKYVLENNYSKDVRAKQKAALKDLIAVYKSNPSLKKDKKMEKLIKADEEGEMNVWLDDNLKISK